MPRRCLRGVRAGGWLPRSREQEFYTLNLEVLKSSCHLVYYSLFAKTSWCLFVDAKDTPMLEDNRQFRNMPVHWYNLYADWIPWKWTNTGNSCGVVVFVVGLPRNRKSKNGHLLEASGNHCNHLCGFDSFERQHLQAKLGRARRSAILRNPGILRLPIGQHGQLMSA